jgi:hypothetical protein
MTSQQRQQHKAKKREKIRKEHLAKAKAERDQRGIEFLCNSRPLDVNLPHKDDCLGWQRYNSLTRQAIFKRALKDYGYDKSIKKFMKGEFLSSKEEDEATVLLSKAAQSICCDPPFFVPYVSVKKNGLVISHREMKKDPTPFGSAWYPDHFFWQIILLDGKTYHFTMSSHCIERIKGRIPFKDTMDILGFFLSLMPLNPVRINNTSICPIITATPKKDDLECLIGYCPVETYRNMAVAKSFLLPGMFGTPEHEKLAKAGKSIPIPEEFSSFEEYCKVETQIKEALKSQCEVPA